MSKFEGFTNRLPTATTYERMVGRTVGLPDPMGAPYPYGPQDDGPFNAPHAVPDRYSAHEIAGAAAWRKIQSAITKDPELGLAIAVFMAGEMDRTRLDERQRDEIEAFIKADLEEQRRETERSAALKELAQLETGELLDRVRAVLVRLDEIPAEPQTATAS